MYMYKGMSLYEYCKDHKELNYNSIRTYVYRKMKQYPGRSEDEIINEYMKKKHKGKYTYYYVGIPLKQYCEEENINYHNLIAYIDYHKNDEEFVDLDTDEFIDRIMDKYVPFKPKYMYHDILLIDYCKQNDIPYSSVLSFVRRKLLNGSNKSIDDLVIEGVENINRYGIIYYYKGTFLKDYALENNMNYNSLRGAILKKRTSSDKELQEIVDECVLNYKALVKYHFNGTTLRKYVMSLGLNYNTILDKFLTEYQGDDINEAINKIINYYIENPYVSTKYYFGNQSLLRFCNANGYYYTGLLRSIKKLKSNNNLISNDEAVKIVVKEYEEKLHMNKIVEIFRNLENYNYNELKDICFFLKINWENVNDLVEMNFSYVQAINLIWYFSDKKDENDFRIITDKKLKSLFLFINSLKAYEENDIENLDIYNLIGIYKSGLYDSRNEIIIKEKKYIYHTIYSLCHTYNIEVNKNNLEDFASEIKIYLIEVIDKICLNVPRQMVKYMDLTVKGSFKTYLKKYQELSKEISLNKDKENEKGVLLDRITYTDNIASSFSDALMESLLKLKEEDRLFIILKYQEQFTDIELANYFKINILEVKEKEKEILSFLKDNQDIQKSKK